MSFDPRLDALARSWRGPLLAALVALAAGLPGLLALPVLDRDEARFAQSTAQMLESGDFIDVAFQDQSRAGEPIGLHWLQAASVSALSSTEAREIWAYRIPSLLGAMLAASACAWGAAAFFGPARGAVAGAILGGCLLLSMEAGIGRPDALLCGMTTLALAALGRLYGAVQCETAQDSEPAGMRTRLVFWLALAGAVLDKGFVGPIIVGVTILALWAWDRRAPWLRGLGWIWGPLLIAAVILPWLAAVTVRTDGAAWSAGSSSGLVGIGPGGWAPPSLHLLALPVLLFPFAALAPAALIEAWKARAEPGVRFALCWLLPNWLLLEASPARLIHQALPLYGAVAWLAAFALTRPMGRVSRILGVALSLLAALAVTAGAIYLTRRFGGPDDAALTVLIGVLCLGASLAGALALTPRLRLPALAAAAGLGVAAHAAIAAGLAPRLSPLWVSERARAVMDRTGIDPRLGLAPGPVTVVGYDEPSLVFLLGTETELGDANDAAQAISEGRPVVIDQTSEPDFTRAMAARSLKATRVGQVAGLDYVDGEAGVLDVYRSDSAPPEPPVRDIPASEDDQAPDAAAPSSGARPTADHSSAAPRPRGKKAHAKHK